MRFTKEVNIYAEGTMKKFQALEAEFKVTKEKISSLISESELRELQSGSKTMYSRMASAEQTLSGLSQEYTDISSKYDTVSGQYTDLNSKVGEYKSAVDNFSAALTQLSNHIETDYSTTQSMQAFVNLTINNLKTEISDTYVTQNKLNGYSTVDQLSAAIEASTTKIFAEVRDVSYYNYCTNGDFDSKEGWKSKSGLRTASYLYKKCAKLLRYKNTGSGSDTLEGMLSTPFISWEYSVNKKQKNEFVFQLAAGNAGDTKIYLDDAEILSIDKTDIADEWKEFSVEVTLEEGNHIFKIQVEDENKRVFVTGVRILAKYEDWTEGRLSILSNSISSEIKRVSDAEGLLETKIEQTETTISSKVSKGSIISEINQTAEDASINAAKINFNGLVTANNYFKIKKNGSFVAAYGTLGGWTVKDGIMKSSDGKIVLDPSKKEIYFGGSSPTTKLSPGGTTTNYLTVYGGTATTSSKPALLIDAASASSLCFYNVLTGSRTDRIFLQGNLKVTGTKSRVAQTTNFSNRLLYCYETPTPMFGDLGCGETNERGIAIIDIDPEFSETVNSGIEYQVFLQKEGDGNVWIEEKEENYFIVRGTPSLKFSWELKCIQRSFEHLRLDEEKLFGVVLEETALLQKDYDSIIDNTIGNYEEDLEELLNESN